MIELLYEIWEDPESNSLEVCLASRRADELRLRISPHATLIRTFRASSHNQAMQIHHDHCGFGTYPPLQGVGAEPFTEAQLRRQREEGYEI